MGNRCDSNKYTLEFLLELAQKAQLTKSTDMDLADLTLESVI